MRSWFASTLHCKIGGERNSAQNPSDTILFRKQDGVRSTRMYEYEVSINC